MADNSESGVPEVVLETNRTVWYCPPTTATSAGWPNASTAALWPTPIPVFQSGGRRIVESPADALDSTGDST